MSSALPLWGEFINWLYSSGAIYVPEEFHSRCAVVSTMMDMEITGLVSTVNKYAINSAKEAEFTVECADQTVEDLLNLWLKEINVNLNEVPTGIKALSEEYYKERWTGSSLCLMRASTWKKISIGANSIEVPTVLWFVNGSSIWIHRPNEKNYILGTDKYYLDEEMKRLPLPNPNKDEDIIIQKPFSRWYDKYPSPYLIQTGIYKNWKALEVLQGKSDEVISKFLPYMLLLKKGTLEGFKEGIEYDDKDMKLALDNFKEQVEKYHKERGKIPTNAIPFDQSYEHLIPDLKNILNEELYNQGSRAILSGLGFVDVIQGISSTRKESVLNPKPFISEVNAGVDGFKTMLMDVIRLIVKENYDDHRKLFSGKNPLRIVNNPIKINVEAIIDSLRSAYVYGSITIETYQEMLGIDPDQELERMKKEWEIDPVTGVNLREMFSPHLIQKTEEKIIEDVLPVKKVPTSKKQIEKQNEKTKAELDEELDDLTIEGFAPVITDKYIRIRQKDPKEFEKDSFRTIILSSQKGIKAIVGRIKGKTTTIIQSYLFDKEKWTVKEAQDWVSMHKAFAEDFIDAVYEIEDSVKELFVKCSKCGNLFDYLSVTEAGMGYIKCPKCGEAVTQKDVTEERAEQIINTPIDPNLETDLEIAPYTETKYPKYLDKYPAGARKVWISTWNSVYKQTGDEVKAFKIAWSALHKYIKRHGNK